MSKHMIPISNIQDSFLYEEVANCSYCVPIDERLEDQFLQEQAARKTQEELLAMGKHYSQQFLKNQA